MRHAVTEAAAAERAPSQPLPPEQFAAIGDLHESLVNPRLLFQDDRLAELASSIREKGIIHPLVVRPRPGKFKVEDLRGFEIVAGARRLRAAKLAGLERVPIVVRDYQDSEVLELALAENIQREDLTPLERAKAFQDLIGSNPDKHSAQSIASRQGLSVGWVWDQLNLLKLVPEAQALLREDRITVKHAVVISRLKPADQKRVIAAGDNDDDRRRTNGRFDSALWRVDHGLDFEDDPANQGKKPGKYDGLKTCSVRELEHWIHAHIRFDVQHAAKATPLEFEAVMERVQEAQAQPGRGRKVIAITFESFTQPDARDDSERTFGPSAWKRADGTKGTTITRGRSRRLVDSPECEASVLGLVIAGAHQGESFKVCVARDKCQVHWGSEIREREKSQKLRVSGQHAKANKADARRLAREQKEEEARRQRHARWERLRPALKNAALAAAEKMPAKIPGPLYARVLSHHRLPAKTKPAQLIKALLLQLVKSSFWTYAGADQERDLVKFAKDLKVDVKKLEPPKAKLTPAAAASDADGGA